MITLKQVNAALKAKGAKEMLFKGAGYFYFAEGDTWHWPGTSVYVYRLNELTLEEWLEEHESLMGESRKLYLCD
jgi:hypothetical protein